LVFYSARGDLNGIRVGDWKYLEITTTNKKNKTSKTDTYLFNLMKDIGEKNSLLEQHPEKVAELKARMKQLDKEITDNARPVWRKPK
jgi:arylsulfatase A